MSMFKQNKMKQNKVNVNDCYSCPITQEFSNRTFAITDRLLIERLIVFDWQNFIVSSIMFD